MAFTVDVTTDIGKVRLLLMDMDSTKPIYPDDSQIQAFLNMEGGDIKQGAALALETIAGNQLMTMKVIELLDLKTDGLSVAKGLLAQAQRLRDYDMDWPGFDIAEMTDSPFAYREKLWKLLIQGSSR